MREVIWEELTACCRSGEGRGGAATADVRSRDTPTGNSRLERAVQRMSQRENVQGKPESGATQRQQVLCWSRTVPLPIYRNGFFLGETHDKEPLYRLGRGQAVMAPEEAAHDSVELAVRRPNGKGQGGKTTAWKGGHPVPVPTAPALR